MWPLDRIAALRKPTLTLHASRHGVSAYAGGNASDSLDEPWLLKDFAAIPASPSTRDITGLVQALQAVIQRQPHPLGRIRLLLDSCWVPVMCVSAGDAVLDSARFDLLARHRLESCHGPAWHDWQPRSPFRPGDPTALVFFLNTKHLDVFKGLSACEWSVMSTVSWVWDVMWRKAHQQAHLSHMSHVHWQAALVEEDRTLVLTFDGRQLKGCHPAMPYPGNLQHIQRLALLEQRRLGVVAEGEVPLRAFTLSATSTTTSSSLPKQPVAEGSLLWHTLQVTEEVVA